MTRCNKHNRALEPWDSRNPDSTLVCGDCVRDSDVHDWDGVPDGEEQEIHCDSMDYANPQKTLARHKRAYSLTKEASQAFEKGYAGTGFDGLCAAIRCYLEDSKILYTPESPLGQLEQALRLLK